MPVLVVYEEEALQLAPKVKGSKENTIKTDKRDTAILPRIVGDVTGNEVERANLAPFSTFALAL